ncbi:MAG TPA: class I SAM-dependent methyltransferase [Thermoanaerobaculia bacterium]|nr:class I SAM-dependent methyltransferase [Thermoanaerobaculia bacterium]
MDQGSFYDDIAEYYDLVYVDWESSMQRHGDAIAAMLGSAQRARVRVLDVSAGIGTQALPLASLGYDVVARDVSEGAISRLRREAKSRGLKIDAAPGDMRNVSSSVNGQFDAVISFDNSIPHLLNDIEIADTFRSLGGLLRPEGVLLISVRDYGAVDRTARSFHSYGERIRDGRTFRLGQEWQWVDASHYSTTMIIESHDGTMWREVVRSSAQYYAVPINTLLDLMVKAGLKAAPVEEVPFFQPVLCGRAG